MIDSWPTLVLNGKLRWTEELAAIARSARPLLAADGGANALARLGLRPQSVIGDLDSISTPTRTWLGEARMIHRPDQERTDFEKALDYAFVELCVARIKVLGALGSRADHTIGNLGVVAQQARGRDLVLRDDRQEILATAQALTLEALPGEIWSFWTFDPGVRVSIEGVRWPVENEVVNAGGRSSISNESVGDEVRVIPSGGAVMGCRNIRGNTR